MDCSIRRLDSRADETREREKGKETTDRSREPCRIMTQHPQILTEQFPLSPHLFAFSLSLSHAHIVVRWGCHVGRSADPSLFLSFYLSFSLSLLPPLNFYYSSHLVLSLQGTHFPFSLIQKITIHEFIEECNVERMVLSPPVSDPGWMDFIFFFV